MKKLKKMKIKKKLKKMKNKIYYFGNNNNIFCIIMSKRGKRKIAL